MSPYVVTRKGDATSTTADIPESDPIDGSYLRYRWFRSVSHRKASVCSVHPGEPAVLQNMHSKSYHCGEECFAQSWREWMRNRIANGGASYTNTLPPTLFFSSLWPQHSHKVNITRQGVVLFFSFIFLKGSYTVLFPPPPFPGSYRASCLPRAALPSHPSRRLIAALPPHPPSLFFLSRSG